MAGTKTFSGACRPAITRVVRNRQASKFGFGIGIGVGFERPGGEDGVDSESDTEPESESESESDLWGGGYTDRVQLFHIGLFCRRCHCTTSR